MTCYTLGFEDGFLIIILFGSGFIAGVLCACALFFSAIRRTQRGA